jgi:hypothetical protein
MEKLARMWLLIGAGGCAILAAVGWAITIYASTSTPQMAQVVVTAANRTTSIQNKAVYLFVFPVFQTWLFVMVLSPTVRWKSMVRKAERQLVPQDISIGKNRGLTFAQWCRCYCFGFWVVSGMALWGAVARAIYVIQR